jgi:hypothetical protein
VQLFPPTGSKPSQEHTPYFAHKHRRSRPGELLPAVSVSIAVFSSRYGDLCTGVFKGWTRLALPSRQTTVSSAMFAGHHIAVVRMVAHKRNRSKPASRELARDKRKSAETTCFHTTCPQHTEQHTCATRARHTHPHWGMRKWLVWRIPPESGLFLRGGSCQFSKHRVRFNTSRDFWIAHCNKVVSVYYFPARTQRRLVCPSWTARVRTGSM